MEVGTIIRNQQTKGFIFYSVHIYIEREREAHLIYATREAKKEKEASDNSETLAERKQMGRKIGRRLRLSSSSGISAGSLLLRQRIVGSGLGTLSLDAESIAFSLRNRHPEYRRLKFQPFSQQVCNCSSLNFSAHALKGCVCLGNYYALIIIRLYLCKRLEKEKKEKKRKIYYLE